MVMFSLGGGPLAGGFWRSSREAALKLYASAGGSVGLSGLDKGLDPLSSRTTRCVAPMAGLIVRFTLAERGSFPVPWTCETLIVSIRGRKMNAARFDST